MDAVFLEILNRSIAAGWLILAVATLRFFLKKAPKWAPCALWAVVALRLVCPVSFESMFSLIPSAQTVSRSAITGGSFDINSGLNAIDAPFNAYFGKYAYESAGELGGTGGGLTELLPWVWLTGIAVMLMYAVISYLKLYRRVKPSLHVRDAIWICDDIKTPFLLGIARPRIYLPSAMDELQRAYIIAHELAHLKRRDHWWKPLGFLLLAVYWFHPLIWLAYGLFCRDIELACDEKVVCSMEKGDRIAYSEALLSCSVSGKKRMACPLAFGEVGVKERIQSVLYYKKPAFWVVIVSVCTCVAVAVCFLTNPKKETAVAMLAETEQASLPDRDGEIIFSSIFTYHGVDYDLADRNQSINALMGQYPVGKYIVVEGHTGPKNLIYCVFDTEAEQFIKDFAGTNLIWRGDDLTTAVYSLWSEIYDYEGRYLASVELPEDGGYIRELAFSEGGTELIVTILAASGDEVETTIDIGGRV